MGLRMAVDRSQKRSPREHLEGLGLAWPETGSTPQVEREGSRGAGGHTQAGPWGAGQGGQHPGFVQAPVCAPTGVGVAARRPWVAHRQPFDL